MSWDDLETTAAQFISQRDRNSNWVSEPREHVRYTRRTMTYVWSAKRIGHSGCWGAPCTPADSRHLENRIGNPGRLGLAEVMLSQCGHNIPPGADRCICSRSGDSYEHPG